MNFLKILFIYYFLLNSFSNQLFAQVNDSLQPATYYYENGQVSSTGTLLNGKPEGYWKSYYRNGNIKSEGNRKQFLLDGLWIFYTEEGVKYLTIDYVADKKNGYRTTYSGTVVLKKEAFINDVKSGNTEQFYASGKLKEQIPYVDGREKGLGYVYDTTGMIIGLKTYKAGVLVKDQRINRVDERGNRMGIWMTFYPNMQTKDEGLYEDDLKHGYWKYYRKDGNLIRVEKWIHGVLVQDAEEVAKIDIRREIDPQTGRVVAIGGYRNGQKDGVHRSYDENGNITGATIYANGIVLAEGLYDEEGRRQGQWKFYYETGTLKEEGNYKNDKREGVWKYYFEDGELEEMGSFRADMPDGIWRWYYPNKQLRLEEEFVDGFEDGPSVEYGDTGQVIAQGNYIEGFKDGTWVYNIGSITETGKYFEGEKQGIWKQIYKDNGKPAFEGEYLNGVPNGFSRHYYSNGLPKRKGKYVMGVRDGNWEYYAENGSLQLTITYQNGQEVAYNGEKISYGKKVDRELEAEQQNTGIQ